MMNDVIFNHDKTDPISAFDDWDLVLTKVENPLPTPKLVTVDIKGADGKLDLSEVATGELRYNNRNIKLTFEMMDVKNYHGLMSNISHHIHGKMITMLFTNDDSYYYSGRATISKWECSKNKGTVVIDVDAYPYKRAVHEINISFSFNGETVKYFDAYTTEKICPKLKVTGTANIIIGDTIISYTDGTYSINEILIHGGVNSITLADGSNGSITLTYRSGVF